MNDTMLKIAAAYLVALLIFVGGVVVGQQTDADLPVHTEATAEPTTTTTAPTTTTTTEAPEPAPEGEPYYALTYWERDLVERVVMAEAGGEAYDGQIAVAQCILNACLLDGIRPSEAIEEYSYTGNRPDPTESVKQAVAAVFDDGVTVFGPDVLYFYAPALCRSDWHETQDYVTTIGCHKFFKEATG
jgi:spore germination cell wall hydrolase CwlJ-like protein